jgi:hypothetical protein
MSPSAIRTPLRHLVSIRRDLDWFKACGEAYQRPSGGSSAERILAWHVRRAGFVRVAAGSPLPDKEAIMATTEGLVGMVHVTANIAGQALHGSSAAI